MKCSPEPYGDPPVDQGLELSFGLHVQNIVFNDDPTLKLETPPKPVKQEPIDEEITGIHCLNHKSTLWASLESISKYNWEVQK